MGFFMLEGGIYKPHKPLKTCKYPGCYNLNEGSYREEHKGLVAFYLNAIYTYHYGLNCTPTCSEDYSFYNDGVEYKKCKNIAFLHSLEKSNLDAMKNLLKQKLTIIIVINVIMFSYK